MGQSFLYFDEEGKTFEAIMRKGDFYRGCVRVSSSQRVKEAEDEDGDVRGALEIYEACHRGEVIRDAGGRGVVIVSDLTPHLNVWDRAQTMKGGGKKQGWVHTKKTAD